MSNELPEFADYFFWRSWLNSYQRENAQIIAEFAARNLGREAQELFGSPEAMREAARTINDLCEAALAMARAPMVCPEDLSSERENIFDAVKRARSKVPPPPAESKGDENNH